jgi:hypothetical protein
MPKDPIVALALLTRANLDALGNNLKKVYPVEDLPCFPELLRAIDDADREHWREEDRMQALERLRASR